VDVGREPEKNLLAMAEHPTPEQEIIFSREDESITTPELEDNESSDTSSTEHIK
jgi:hypothetical protein